MHAERWDIKTFRFKFKFTFANFSVSLDCSTLNSDDPAIRLRKNLFCKYDSSTRPGSREEPIKVQVDFLVKSFDFVSFPARASESFHPRELFYLQYESMSSLNLKYYIELSWMDSRLTWNPDRYDKQNFSTAAISDLWIPDISIYNSWVVLDILLALSHPKQLQRYIGRTELVRWDWLLCLSEWSSLLHKSLRAYGALRELDVWSLAVWLTAVPFRVHLKSA